MIARVAGEVLARREGQVVLDTAGGVAYRLLVSAETLRHVPAVGQSCALHAYLAVREDAMVLFGFHAEEEQDLFELLLEVPSVGPKLALAVLSGGTPRDLLAALASGDQGRFQAVPGIGKRTAERIVVELRGKVGAPEPDLPISVRRTDDPRGVARDGLLELGFAPQEAERLVGAAEGDTAEALLQSALRASRA